MLVFNPSETIRENERSSDDAPDEHHVVPACLPAMMMNHQISGFEIIIPKSFVVM